jgi:signal transduction histidine kinase
MARRSPPSLSQRLLALAALWIAGALVVAGVVLTDLFRTHAEAELGRRIEHHLDELAAALSVAADGTVTVAASLTEPRFHRPLSGLYWQVTAGGTVLRSRSLWDQTLALPVDLPADGAVHQHPLRGFRSEPLIAWERSLRLLGVSEPVRIAVVADASNVAAATGDFSRVLAISLALLALGLLAAAVAQVRLGLAPLERLRLALGDLRSGHKATVADRFPAEVQPLVDDLNGLLEANAAMVERARGRAADLAHALKTPLAVIANAAAAYPEGDLLVAEADRMRRQIDRHLARARSAGAGRSPRTSVVAVLDPLVRTVARLNAARAINVALSGDPVVAVRIDAQDLQEMVGNLIDNAAKWCRSTVRVSVVAGVEGVRIFVDDDGPGIPDADRAAVLARGGRLDETAPGQGLGLAITGDLVHDHGGTLTLDRSELGGLRAALNLPLA